MVVWSKTRKRDHGEVEEKPEVWSSETKRRHAKCRGSVITMPGVRESIEQKRWTNVDREIERVARALQQKADLLNAAARCVAGGLSGSSACAN